ncbi:unnamed protein product, partial [Amoebophrya sp. A25]|eukprot:GSA25T00006369001.1
MMAENGVGQLVLAAHPESANGMGGLSQSISINEDSSMANSSLNQSSLANRSLDVSVMSIALGSDVSALAECADLNSSEEGRAILAVIENDMASPPSNRRGVLDVSGVDQSRVDENNRINRRGRRSSPAYRGIQRPPSTPSPGVHSAFVTVEEAFSYCHEVAVPAQRLDFDAFARMVWPQTDYQGKPIEAKNKKGK